MGWYRTGTISVTNGSATVTGAGTAFVQNVRAGYGLVGPDGKTYEVLEVVSNTQLTLAEPYTGATAGGQAYRIFPTQSVIADLATEAAELINSFAAVRDGVGAGLHPDGSAASPAIRFSADQDTGFYRPGSNVMGIATGGTLRVSVDATGLSAVGKLLAAPAGTTPEATYNGTLVTAKPAASGQHINLIRSGSFVWSIGYVYNTHDFAIGAGQATDASFTAPALVIQAVGNAVRPGSDNAAPIGTGTYRWSDVYAVNGTINTSDERDKTWRGALTDTEYEAGLQVLDELGFYQWNDAVEVKGVDGARSHFGVRAQQVWAIFAQHELVDSIVDGEPGETPYAFLCFDKWDAVIAPAHQVPTGLLDEQERPIMKTVPATMVSDAGSRFGIRPDELNLFLIAVQARRSAELEARIAAIESPAP